MACRRQFEDDDSNSQAKADAIVRLLCQDMRTNINLPIGGSVRASRWCWGCLLCLADVVCLSPGR